jgi:hypothetical protein
MLSFFRHLRAVAEMQSLLIEERKKTKNKTQNLTQLIYGLN